ncbi:MAG: hypothetical protein ABFS56_10740 [Pseudomonadota bacterium]
MKNSDEPLYFDTSALLPYYRLEVLTHTVQAVLNAARSDALHLAYAARLDAVLVTADKKLGQAAGDFGVRYQLLIARLH